MTTICIQLTEVKCWVCGCDFAVDSNIEQNKRRYGKTLFCPNGCRLGFGDTPEQVLRKEMEQKLAQAKREKEWIEAKLETAKKDRDNYKRSLSATKGVVKRIKNRVSAGVCPCCNRHFENLQRHMTGKHPEFTKDGER